MNELNKTNKTQQEQLANKVRRLASEAIDIYCHGIDSTGKKGLIYTPNKETISTLFAYPRKPSPAADAYTTRCYNEDIRALSKLQQDHSFSGKKILKHIKGVEKQYYCNSQFGRVFWMGLDIDNDTDNYKVLFPWFEFLRSHFPGVWMDSGSSGNSLHTIIRTNMAPLLNYFMSLNQSKLSYPAVANKVVYAIAHIIKLYGHLILTPDHKLIMDKKGKIVPAYDVELCSIKGSYSDWDYYISKTGEVRLIDINRCGTLFKFPNIFTDADYTKFKNAPIYSIVDIINFSIYLSSSLSLSQTLSPEQVTKLSKDGELLEAVLSANGVSLPSFPVPESVLVEPVAVMPVTTPVPASNIREEEKEEEEKNKSIGPYFGLESVNSDDISGYDPFKRCRITVQMLYRILGRKPDYDEWNTYYEANGWNTGDDVEGRRKARFESVIPYVEAGFDYSKIGSGRYHKPGDNMVDAKAMISEQELKQWNTGYDKNIDYNDIDMMIGYTRSCLNDDTGRANYDKERWAGTIPVRGLKNFWQRRKDQGQIKRSYSHGKATSLMALMLSKGWLIKTANHHAGDSKCIGIACKYEMTDLHPYYQEWQEHQATIKSHRDCSQILKKRTGVAVGHIALEAVQTGAAQAQDTQWQEEDGSVNGRDNLDDV
ncbi:MAG: hypothetical protein ACYSTR_02795 [Planctomycetota bacterium]